MTDAFPNVDKHGAIRDTYWYVKTTLDSPEQQDLSSKVIDTLFKSIRMMIMMAATTTSPSQKT